MLCDKCGGFGNYPYDFTINDEGNKVHITCIEDYKTTIKTDAMIIMQAVICGFLSTTSYKQGKYKTMWQAASDALIPCFGGSPTAEFSKEDCAQIIWDICKFVGQLGYKSYIVEGGGFTFANETKTRSIVYEFHFGQIKEKLDSLTYNKKIVSAMEEDGEEFDDYNGQCMWCEKRECNEGECSRNLNSCGWMVNIGLSFDYILKHEKPFFNFFKDDFNGMVATWNDNGKMCGLMADMSTIDYLKEN